MAAPSSDWFVGLDSINMCDSTTGEWMTMKEIDIANVYDAGTDSGDCFTCRNAETFPNDPITMVMCGENFCASGVLDIGDFTIMQFACDGKECGECQDVEGCVYTDGGCMLEEEVETEVVLDFCPADTCPFLECETCIDTPECAMTKDAGCLPEKDVPDFDQSPVCPLPECGTFCCVAARTRGKNLQIPPSANAGVQECYEACLALPQCKVWEYLTQHSLCRARGNKRSKPAEIDFSKPDLQAVSGKRNCDPSFSFIPPTPPPTAPLCDCCDVCIA